MGNTQRACDVLKKSLKLNSDQKSVKESLKELEKIHYIPSYLPKEESFKAAFAEINITPNVSENNPVILQGMGGPPRKTTAVSNPLMMQLLLLEDDHFTKVLFVTGDLFGFGPEIVENVRTLVAPWGIEPEGLILNASHTHYAPGTISHAASGLGPFHKVYAKHIVQTIGQHLPILFNRLEQCDLSMGKTEVQIGVNRRLKKDGKIHLAPNENGYYDKHTPFLVVHFKSTRTKVLLVSHGCHPTGLGTENNLSADFPGYMRQSLVNSGTANAVMFLQGAGGSTKQSIKGTKDIVFCDNSEGARQNGEYLAKKITESLENGVQPVKGSFFCTFSQVTLPLKRMPPSGAVKQIKNNWAADNLVREWANSVLERFPNGDYPTTLITEIQLIALGDNVIFFTLPGEPVAEMAKDIRRLSSNPDSVFVLGYTNGLLGYFPTDTMIKEGGYEAEASQFFYLLPSALDKGTQSAIISSAKKCMGTYLDKNEPNGYGRYHLAKKKQKTFFVLSAGRCGTMTLAHILNTATNARVWHHPQPDPIKESLLAYWGDIDKKKAFWKARYPIIHKTWSEGLIHGESDLLMTPFCGILANEIPDSKFILLVRDPRDFVRSGMRRNYYCGHPWDFGRLKPKEGTDAFEAWNKRNQFEKVCWLWRETYEHILKITNKISRERLFVLRFEDLEKDAAKAEELFDFLGLKGFHRDKIGKILQEKLNSQKGGHFSQPKDWSDELLNELWNECGEVAKVFGYVDELVEIKLKLIAS